MGRGISYPRQLGEISDLARIGRTVIENFRVTADFINGYVPTYESGSTDLILPGSLQVTGDLSVAGEIRRSGTKRHIWAYDAAGSQGISATSWTPVNLDTEQGTSDSTTFTLDTVNDAIDVNVGGIYVATGNVTFQATESGYLRILGNGTDEFARNSFNTRLNHSISCVFYVATASQVTFEVYSDTAATTSASPTAYTMNLQIAQLYDI